MLWTCSVRVFLCAALSVLPVFAFAHPGHAESGLITGMAHPVTGIDHLLAMFAVGLWAAQQKKGIARWMLPVTFAGCMVPGALLGFGGFTVMYLETGIAASVLALGILVAVAARPPMILAIVISGLFGLAHGTAHGLELPGMSSPWEYVAGFVAATSALHAAGYVLARWTAVQGAAITRVTGLASAATGAMLLVG